MPTAVTAAELAELARDFVAAHPQKAQVRPFWRSPILATAKADERFDILGSIASPGHMTPGELLPGAQSVVVFFVPFTHELAGENFGGKFPARSWGEAYAATNHLIGLISEMLGQHLRSAGHACELTPATHNFDPVDLSSRWSHKHLAHIAGLGRFGHNHLIITPKGCAGRFGSLVTSAKLGDNPLVTQEHTCLYKAGEECLKCVDNCPVEALTSEGLDRQRCWQRLQFNYNKKKLFDDLPPDTHVCAKCAMDLPCTFEIPVAAG